MKRKDLYMHSTDVNPSKTILEITTYLVRMGALSVMTHYDEKTREPSGVFFQMKISGNVVPFMLPARIEPIYAILHAGRYGAQAPKDMDQAKRVAWRQIYRWIQAQTALIETGMVDAAEAMTPFVQVGPNETLYQKAVAGGFQRLLSTNITSEP